MALCLCIKKKGTARMNQWMVFVVAAVVWSGYFYGLDMVIMEGQGLPVGMDLMPL